MHSCAFGHMLSYNILGLCVHDWTAKRLTGLMRYLLCNSFVILIGFSLYCIFLLGHPVEERPGEQVQRAARFRVTRWGSAQPSRDPWRRRRMWG